MFRANKKYRLIYLSAATLLFGFKSVFDFLQFVDKSDGMKMIGGIIFGIAAIIFSVEVYNFLKNNKSIKSGA
jgi:hypothetical protein